MSVAMRKKRRVFFGESSAVGSDVEAAESRRADSLLSVAEVADRLAVSPRTVWRLIQAGKIGPVHKLGARLTRVPAAAVARYLEATRASVMVL